MPKDLIMTKEEFNQLALLVQDQVTSYLEARLLEIERGLSNMIPSDNKSKEFNDFINESKFRYWRLSDRIKKIEFNLLKKKDFEGKVLCSKCNKFPADADLDFSRFDAHEVFPFNGTLNPLCHWCRFAD